MVKCQVIKDFTLSRFNEIIELERKSIEQYGKLFIGDRFKCNKEMAEYLLGNNEKGSIVIKIIEVIPGGK